MASPAFHASKVFLITKHLPGLLSVERLEDDAGALHLLFRVMKNRVAHISLRERIARDGLGLCLLQNTLFIGRGWVALDATEAAFVRAFLDECAAALDAGLSGLPKPSPTAEGQPHAG